MTAGTMYSGSVRRSAARSVLSSGGVGPAGTT